MDRGLHNGRTHFFAAGDRDENVDPKIKRCLLARRELRRASNEGALRAFRNADRNQVFFMFSVADLDKGSAFISTPDAAETGSKNWNPGG